jgi:predicted ester cyclase
LTDTLLPDLYRRYIACLNGKRWDELGHFIDDNVKHNGRAFGLAGYREMLVNDYAAIPDLHFHIDLIVCQAPHAAARLLFDCTPKGIFLGLRVDGRMISFAENVFNKYRDTRIVSVRSAIDKAAIEMQLRP